MICQIRGDVIMDVTGIPPAEKIYFPMLIVDYTDVIQHN
jgi:hypothetical protein